MNAVDLESIVEIDDVWLVAPNARFEGCAPHEESVDIVTAGSRRMPRHVSGHRQNAAAACGACGEVNQLVYRNGAFRCKEPASCEKRASRRR